MRITHCDVFAGFRKGVCARTGVEVAVKQQQLSSGVKGDKSGLPCVISEDDPLPCLGRALRGGFRDPSERQVESTQHSSSSSLQTAIILGCHLCMQRCQRRNLRLIEHRGSSLTTLLSSGLCMPRLLNSMQLFSLLSRQRHLVWCSLCLNLVCFSNQPVANTAWLPGPLPLPVKHPVFLSRSEMVEEVMQY